MGWPVLEDQTSSTYKNTSPTQSISTGQQLTVDQLGHPRRTHKEDSQKTDDWIPQGTHQAQSP